MDNFRRLMQVPKEGLVAFVNLEQFTKREALEWLKAEEMNAHEIARDGDERGLHDDADYALIRAEACAKLRTKIRRAKAKKVFDLETELGTIQQMLGRSLS